MKLMTLFVCFLAAIMTPGLGQDKLPCLLKVEGRVSSSSFVKHGVNVPVYDLYVLTIKIYVLILEAEFKTVQQIPRLKRNHVTINIINTHHIK